MVKKERPIITLKKLVTETSKLIRRYIDNYSDELPKVILSNITEIFQNNEYLKLLVSNSDLGQSFFTNLQLYIRARYAYLEALINKALLSKKKPIFGTKLILDYASKGYFPVSQQINIRGISIEGVRKALISLVHQREVKGKSRVINGRTLPNSIQYIIKKRERLRRIREIILSEIKIAGGECPISLMISELNRPISEETMIYRVIALIQLIRNNELEIVKEDNDFVVKLSGNE